MRNDYETALQYLNQFYERTMNRKDKYHLELMEELLAHCALHLEDFTFVQIAGSCGKGSTAHFISSILQENGLNHGLFTGPHLQHYEERFRVNGEQISRDEFAQIVMHIAAQLEQYPRFHEVGHMHIMILIALFYFKKRQVPLIVFENGVGGESDPSNVFEPIIAVLTEITLDHCHLLGDSIQAITENKMQIIKEKTSAVICGMKNEEARALLMEKEKSSPSSFLFYERDYEAQNVQTSLAYNRFDYISKEHSLKGISLPLLGAHQIQNAANALAAIECLAKEGFIFSWENVHRGLEQVSLSCRMEFVEHNGISFLFDGAHNSLELKTLKDNIERLNLKVAKMILTVSSNKDIREMMEAIYLEGVEIWLVPNPFLERRVSFTEMTAYLDTLPHVTYRTFPAIESALKALHQEKGERDEITLVTGSLYLVGAIKNIINQGEHRFAENNERS